MTATTNADSSSRSARNSGPDSRAPVAWWDPEIRGLIAWYNLWIGAYWDRKKKRPYLMLLPCIGFVFDWSGESLDAPTAVGERALARND